MNEGLLSSNSAEWATPLEFYKKLNNEFNFTLDPCSTDENHKCNKYYTKKENGLIQEWKNERVYCNPPYGKEITKWIEKAYKENEQIKLL